VSSEVPQLLIMEPECPLFMLASCVQACSTDHVSVTRLVLVANISTVQNKREPRNNKERRDVEKIK
jgi:hypothetical protein